MEYRADNPFADNKEAQSRRNLWPTVCVILALYALIQKMSDFG